MIPTDNRTVHHDVLVIGGGNAGLSIAGRLHRYGVADVAVIEPRSHHRYQPLFSHVAGGTARASQAVRPQGDVTPRGVSRAARRPGTASKSFWMPAHTMRSL